MIWVVAVVGACWWSSHRIERRWVRSSSASTAVVARAIVFLTALTTIGQITGAVGLLRPAGILAGAALFSVVGVVAGRAHGHPSGQLRRSPIAPVEVASYLIAVAAVASQWTAHLGDALGRGMVQPDNLWYHGPFVARIAQTADLGSLAPFGYSESQYFPLNTHVLGAMLTLATNSDVLIPFLNHGFAALALVAAWAIGRPHGASVPAAISTLAVLGLPLVAATQPGQMYNDVAALAAVLAAGALLFGDDRRPGDPNVVLAFLALGWALSTKLSAVAPIAVLAIVFFVVLVRSGRVRVAAVGGAAFAITGGVWFLRNVLVSGSPLPYADLTVGPVGFPQRVSAQSGETLFEVRADGLGEYYLEALDTSIGPLWPVALGLGIVGAVAGTIRLTGVPRIIAASGLVGLATFPFTPLTGGLAFVNNLRYGLVALTLSLLGAALLASRLRGLRIALSAALAAVALANLTAPHRGRVPAWPDEPGWIVAGAVVGLVGGTLPWWWRPTVERVGLAPRFALVVGGAAGLLVLVWAVPALEEPYLQGRYTSGDLTDAPLYRAVDAADPDRVDAFGAIETYPYFGPHLDRQVSLWNEEFGELEASGAEACRPIREWLSQPFDAGITDAVLVSADGWVLRSADADERALWFDDDPAIELLVADGDAAAYSRSGPLDPDRCPVSPP